MLTACEAPPEETAVYELRGRYIAPAFNGEAAIIEHEAIPNGMQAMRMSMRVADHAEWTGISGGNAVQFDLVTTSDDLVFIRNPILLPDTTTLMIPSDMAPPADSTDA